MTELAKFLKSIGIDLKGETQPELKTISLTKIVKKIVEGKVRDVEEEYAKEYHIYPYKAFGGIIHTTPKDRANVQKPLLVINGDSEEAEKILGYLNKVFLETSNKQPVPYYNYLK